MNKQSERIVGRYYWVIFADNKWQIARWSKYGDWDTALFNQDWLHGEATEWILIPTPEELTAK